MLRPLQEPVRTSVSLTSLINLLKLALGINVACARIWDLVSPRLSG